MNQVQSFIHNILGEVRIIPSETGNQLDTLFCAVDVCKCLNYHPKSYTNAIRDNCRYLSKIQIPHPQNPNKTLKVNFIPLSDVFSLIFKSRRPEAEEFRRWICEEVLPSIYMTGDFIGNNHDQPVQTNPVYQLSEEEINYVINNPDCTTTYIYDNYGESGSFDNRSIIYPIAQILMRIQEINNVRFDNLSQQINDIKDKPNMIIPARIVK